MPFGIRNTRNSGVRPCYAVTLLRIFLEVKKFLLYLQHNVYTKIVWS